MYDMASHKPLINGSMPQEFKDAFAGSVLARNLTVVDPHIFEIKYPELSFTNSGITANNTGGYGQVIQSLRTQSTGGFAVAGNLSSNNGKISMTGETSSLMVTQLEAESSWSESEVKQSAMQNINLVSDYIKNHNKIYLRDIDQIGYVGRTGIGAGTGLLNHAGFTSAVATGAIATLTGQQMYNDISNLITAQHNAVNNTPEYMATNVDMPTYVLNKLRVTMLNTASSPSSVLKALKANFPGISFRGTFQADNAGGVGVSHTVAYSKNSESMQFRLPVPLTVGEIVKQGSFSFHVDSFFRVGGLDVLENAAGYILTGL